RSQIEEHEAAPAGDANRIETELRLIETRNARHVRSTDEPAVEIVAPLMVGAGDAPPADPAGEVWHTAARGNIAAQARAPVAAGVVEGAQLLRATAHQDDALAENLEQTPGAGLAGELLIAT